MASLLKVYGIHVYPGPRFRGLIRQPVKVRTRALIPIVDKVKVVADREFEALVPKFQPSRVTITTKSGASHSTRIDVPKGDPRDPMAEEEIAIKFTALGGDVIGQGQCRKLQSFIMSL
jgi:2-methylcitrate dehydratase